MSRWALIRSSDGLVRNQIEWDGVTKWSPPDGHIVRVLAPDESPNPGSAVYDDTTDRFSDDGLPKEPVGAPPPLTADQKFEKLTDLLVERGVLAQADVNALAAVAVVDGVVLAADPVVP